jgi:hypothetical protein
MSTTCNIDLSLSKIQSDLINGKNPLNEIKENLPNMNAEDVYSSIVKLRGLVETKLVSGAELKLNPALLDSNGKTSRYVWKGTNEVAFKGRATDVSKIATAKRFKNDRDKSETADSIIQKDMGTAIHAVSQAVMEHLIQKDDTGLIRKNSQNADYNYKVPDNLEEFARSLNLTTAQYENLYKGVEEIFEQIKDKQRLTNEKSGLTEQAFIITEQFAFSKEIGSTIDLMYILSNKTTGVFDYKSISTRKSELDQEWIPNYKLQSMNLQMSKIHDILKKELGLNVESIRVVPIQVQFAGKAKGQGKPGAYLINRLSALRMGKDASEFLKQIPMITEKFESSQLTETLNRLLILKNNVVVELNSTSQSAAAKRQDLEKKLSNINKQINDVQVDRDIASTYEYFKELVDRYSAYEKGTYRLKDVDSFTIEGKDFNGEITQIRNKNYLSLQNMRDLHSDITTLINILNSTEEFMQELGIKDKEKYDRLRQIQGEYSVRANVMLSDLNDRMLHRAMTDEKIEELKDSYALGFLGKNFSRASEQDNVLIQEFSRLTSLANDKRRLSVQTFQAGLESVLLPLQQWGKRNGKSGFSIYDILIDEKTGNLHNTYTAEFFQNLKEQTRIIDESKNAADVKKAKEEILKYYTLKDNASEIYENLKENYKRNYNPTNEELLAWEKRWQFDSKYVLTKKINVLYKLDSSKVEDKYFTKEYLNLKKPQNKEALDFYNFWEKNMYKFLNMLEVYGEGNYSNFIPWMKAEFTEALAREGMSGGVSELKESMRLGLGLEHKTEDLVTGDKYVTGKIDPTTGEQQRTIPRFFLNPIFNNEGKVDTTLKSFDLGRSILLFAEMAYDYKYKSEIEPILETLKDISLTDVAGLIAEERETKIPGGETYKLKGVKNEVYEYLDKMIKYNVYGLQYDMDKKTAKYVRPLMALDRYNKKRLFAFNLTSAIKAQTASRAMIMFEGIKGIYYTREMMSKSTGLQAKAMQDAITGNEKENLFIQIAKFFSLHGESITPDRISKLSVDPFASFAGMSTEDLVNFLGRGDRAIDNMLLISMMQNYGVHDGKIIRLNKPSNKDLKVKSLLDLASIKNGKLIIEGITDENGKVNTKLYNQFRNIAMNVAISVKGTMSNEDINMVGVGVMSKLFMSLKTFIPALAKERFQGINYNKVTGEVTVGRYQSIMQNIFSTMGENEKQYLDSIKDDPNKVATSLGFIGFLTQNFLKQGANLVYLMSTYGLANLVTLGRASNMSIPEWSKNLIIAEERSRAIFENYKAKYPNNKAIQEMKYEDFLHYKLQQARAMAVELAGAASLFIILGRLKGMDLDEDDKKDYQENKLMRYTYRQLLGVYRELSFFVNPSDWTNNIQYVTPTIGLIKTLGQLVSNTGDEAMDLVLGEDSKRDKSPIFYYSSKLIPYVNPLARQLELFESDQKVYY